MRIKFFSAEELQKKLESGLSLLFKIKTEIKNCVF
jgi:hypothetical protein